MLGKDNGVVARLRNYTKNADLIVNHCFSHRLNLVAKDIWKNDKSLSLFNSTIHTLCGYFSRSVKRTIILNEEEEEKYFESHLRLLKPIDIRWLSLYHAINRIHELYPALLSTLKIIVEQDGCLVAEGLVTRMKSIHFVSLLHIFKVISSFLEPLNLLFQRKNLDVGEVLCDIETSIKSLERLSDSESYGYHFEDFIDFNEGKEPPIFQNISLSSLYYIKLEHMKIKSKQLQSELLEHLKERLSSQNDLKLFTVFDLRNIALQNSKEIDNYGDESVKDLIKKYQVNVQDGLGEWIKFKIFVSINYPKDTREQIWQFALTSPLDGSLRHIFHRYLTIPLSTAMCERTFNKMNIIKMN